MWGWWELIGIHIRFAWIKFRQPRWQNWNNHD